VVQVEEGLEHGDLFELERTTYFRVIDTRSQEIVMTFEGEMSASLGNGTWQNYLYTGVCEVVIAPDEQTVRVKYYDGREVTIPLPK